MTGVWWLLAAACSGEPPAPVETVPEVPPSVVPVELVRQAWQVRLAPDAARSVYEGRDSWVAWLEGRRTDALRGFAMEKDAVALGRAHLEYAAVYALATEIAARATVEVYGRTPTEGDPAEVAYLVGVGGALLRLPERSRLGASAKLPAVATMDAAWAKIEGRPDAPPVKADDVVPGPPTPGELPTAGTVPHLHLQETLADGLAVPAEDPSTSWALMDWHRRAALVAAPDLTAAAPFLLLPWRGPDVPETAEAPRALPDSVLFLSLGSTAADLLFFGSVPGIGQTDQMRQFGTPYGVIAAYCRTVEDFADCVAEQAQRYGDDLEREMAAVSGGEQGFQRRFADRARVGAIIYGAQVAELLGGGAECPEVPGADGGPVPEPSCAATAAERWRVPTGRLRVTALDRADAANLNDPVVWLWIAAWDVGNRNTVRATELVHRAQAQVPGLDAARVPLDALHLRVSRNAAPALPMH